MIDNNQERAQESHISIAPPPKAGGDKHHENLWSEFNNLSYKFKLLVLVFIGVPVVIGIISVIFYIFAYGKFESIVNYITTNVYTLLKDFGHFFMMFFYIASRVDYVKLAKDLRFQTITNDKFVAKVDESITNMYKKQDDFMSNLESQVLETKISVMEFKEYVTELVEQDKEQASLVIKYKREKIEILEQSHKDLKAKVESIVSKYDNLKDRVDSIEASLELIKQKKTNE